MMMPNPEPIQSAFFLPGQRPVLQSDTDRPVGANLLELKGGIGRIPLPKMVVLDRQAPNIQRQSGKHTSEVFRDRGMVLPAAISFSASCQRKSNFPALASSSICRSQASSRWSINRSVNFQNSSFGKAAMAFSISSTVLMKPSYPFPIKNQTQANPERNP